MSKIFDQQKLNNIYIDEQSLILDSFRLGRSVYKSEFQPDFIVGIWRGGSAVGIVVQECMQYLGVETDHIAIRTSYRGMQHYAHMIEDADAIRVHGLDYLEDRLESNHRLLLVDDVFSSGYSIQAVKNALSSKLRRNMPKQVRVGTVWYRPVENRPKPDFYINESNRWLVLPYELTGLDLEQIRKHKPWAAPVIETIDSPK